MFVLFLPGSHGCHLFGTEPEDKSAGVGARGSVQSSPETQHEETHLNRHVDTHHSLSSLDLILSQTLIGKNMRAHMCPDRSPGQSDLLSPFLIYLFNTLDICTHTHTHTYTHTGRGCIARKSAEEEKGKLTYLLLLGRQTCIYFHSFHMHSPSSPFILSSSCGEETHQLMFSFTVIGWFKAASVNCAPPPPPTALHLHSAILLLLSSPSLPSFAFALLTSFLQMK